MARKKYPVIFRREDGSPVMCWVPSCDRPAQYQAAEMCQRCYMREHYRGKLTTTRRMELYRRDMRGAEIHEANAPGSNVVPIKAAADKRANA